MRRLGIDLRLFILHKSLLNLRSRRLGAEPLYSVGWLATYLESEYSMPYEATEEEVMRLEAEGLVEVERKMPPRELVESCVAERRVHRKGVPEERLWVECAVEAGYTEIPFITDAGVAELCRLVARRYRHRRRSLELLLKADKALGACLEKGLLGVG